MTRITKTKLNEMLKHLNSINNTAYELDHLSGFGYVITDCDGSKHITNRMTSREIYGYLMGATYFPNNRG